MAGGLGLLGGTDTVGDLVKPLNNHLHQHSLMLDIASADSLSVAVHNVSGQPAS